MLIFASVLGVNDRSSFVCFIDYAILRIPFTMKDRENIKIMMIQFIAIIRQGIRVHASYERNNDELKIFTIGNVKIFNIPL